MNTIQLVIWALATSGMAIALSWSKIFAPLRDFLDVGDEIRREYKDPYSEVKMNLLGLISNFLWSMLSCVFCTGFWSGILIYVLMIYVPVMYPVIFGLAGSTVAYAVYSRFFR